MKNKNFISIRNKMIFALGFSALIALFLSTISIFIYTINAEKNSGMQSLSQITKIMGQNLIATIEFDDRESADAILRSLILDENIEAAFIFKDDESIFSSYNVSGNPEYSSMELILKTNEVNNMQNYFEYIDFDYMIISSPIYFEGNYLATLSIISNTDKFKNTISEQFSVVSMVFLVTILIVLFFSFKIQQIYTAPIFQMKKAMENISLHNNYDVHIEPKNNDEFKILFDGFNYMIDTIQNRTLELQEAKKEVELINKYTRDSIEYASIIQNALIPEDKMLRKYFQDIFVISRPKDLVGGDIYLFEELRNEDECLLMVIDCTGHGVPGAFVTMLVKAIERQVTAHIKYSDEVVSPANILKIFNRNMKELLKQESKSSLSNAGLDGGILYYNKKDKIIKFAGAEIPLFYVEDDELKMIKGHRYSVGYKSCDIEHEYEEHTIDVKEGMQFYLTTDGYLDQNGGEKGFCFGKKRFKSIIEKQYLNSMAEQQKVFVEELANYQDNYETNDDITFVGFKI